MFLVPTVWRDDASVHSPPVDRCPTDAACTMMEIVSGVWFANRGTQEPILVRYLHVQRFVDPHRVLQVAPHLEAIRTLGSCFNPEVYTARQTPSLGSLPDDARCFFCVAYLDVVSPGLASPSYIVPP